VGQKRLVRIDEVGRTAAAASLVGEIEEATNDGGPADGGPDGDGVESKPRRRGRRGGRRRSGARAEDHAPAASE
jgi:ribonuclease G